ncbi:MAG: hypothetical protein ACJ0G4_05680 [Alphaproteobacteria bacterium]|tara:strand:- start:607 stop:858 length:252 start_codon:yes stop_codon:yes gene_type:complete
MKFLSFLIIFGAILLTISIKLIVANQEGKLKIIKSQINEVHEKIEKKQADISYSTRPQQLKKINEENFQLSPILQSDIIKRIE